MTTLPRLLAIGASAFTLLALTACGPGGSPTPSSSTTPSSSSSPTPSASPSEEPPTDDPGPVADAIQVWGVTLRVLAADDSVIVEIPYTSVSGADAADQLTEYLGMPTVTSVPGGSCVHPTTKYDWGGLVLQDPADVIGAPGSLFTVTVLATATAGGMTLEGPYGVQVGMDKDDVLAAVPLSVYVDNGFGGGTLHLETVNATPEFDSWGAAGFVIGETMNAIVTPVYFYGDC